MPSVFTIQGPDLSVADVQPNKRDLNELCDIRTMLVSKATKARGWDRRAYQTAADIVQHYIEDAPGGHDYFWSGRCGTKKRRR
jgi:hypothetical protein